MKEIFEKVYFEKITSMVSVEQRYCSSLALLSNKFIKLYNATAGSVNLSDT